MDCNIIRDLLPLYHDGACSEESCRAVEEHLKNCEDCRRVLAEMAAPLPEPMRQENTAGAEAVRKISGEWKKSKWAARLKGAVVAAAACVVLFGLWYGLTQWYSQQRISIGVRLETIHLIQILQTFKIY